MTDRENRVNAIIFDLKQAIDDLLHELEELIKDVDKIKQRTGLR